MWVTVIVKRDGTVTVRPDNPSEGDASYQRARAGAVFEHRTELDQAGPGDIPGAIQAVIDVLARAMESAPLPD